MTTRFTRLEALVPFARLRCKRGFYDGMVTSAAQAYMDVCRHQWAYNAVEFATIIFTRDVGHHTSGWWKNPDYERCFHLSLSYWANWQSVEHDRGRSELIARAFFGDDAKLCWIEGPYSPEGKAAHVWHYRLFVDEGWAPLMPRGEVYSKDWTPADWKSFSDVHGYTPLKEDATFLLEGSR